MIFVLIVTLLIVLFILYVFFYTGKQYKSCKTCKDNEILFIDVEEVKVNEIENLMHILKTEGTRLNPELNFNQAKGKKINIDKIPESIKKLFLTEKLLQNASEAVGENVYFTNDDDKYKIFARIYDDENDFIDWHYDNNFTDGNRYTLVIPLLIDDCNTSEFSIKNRTDGKVRDISIPIGKGVLYNGAEVYHRITTQTQGCRRLVVIIPLYSNPKLDTIGKLRQRIRGLIYKKMTL